MNFKILNNGYKMPTIGLGTWLSKEGEVYNIVKEAIKLGYRHIDCASCYENEKEVGRALKEVIEEGIVRREELFITSKLWNNAHKKEDVIPALKKTLEDLNLEYLDLYLIHWPVAFVKEVFFAQTANEYISLEQLPIIETYSQLEVAYETKLVKAIGVSNFSIPKLEDLISKASIKPMVNQIELHPYLAQEKMLEFCMQNNIAITCYSPLGSSGRPSLMKADNEPSLLENKVILELANKYQKTPAQIILNWSLNRDCIVIPKTVTPNRALENLNSDNFKMEEEDYNKILKLDYHFRYVNGAFFQVENGPYTVENLWDE